MVQRKLKNLAELVSNIIGFMISIHTWKDGGRKGGREGKRDGGKEGRKSYNKQLTCFTSILQIRLTVKR